MTKILVVALDNLGDAVMAAATIPALRQLYPKARIGFWIKQYAAGLFEGNSLIETLHASDPFWDKSPGRPTGSLKEFVGAWKKIRNARYDVAFVLNTEWRRSLACWLARIPIRVGFRKRKSQFFLTHAVPPAAFPQHCIDDHRHLIESYAGKALFPRSFAARLEVSIDDLRKWRAWAQEHGWQFHPVVAIQPFAGHERRCWPLASWVRLIHLFLANRPETRFAIICGPGEQKKATDVFASLPSEVYRIWDAPPLAETKTVISQARLFVGGDSGPGHIAAALGVPVISLFGPSNPERFAPQGAGFIKIIKKVPLAELSPEEVFKLGAPLIDSPLKA